MNNQAQKDLEGYWRIFIKVAAVFLSLKFILIALAYFLSSSWLSPLVGALFGASFAMANLLALSWAYYRVIIKKAKKTIIFLPVVTFLFMCFMAYIYAMFLPDQVIGFAMGLSVPIIFASFISLNSNELKA
jgi:hypothetical protein